ncbi:phosphoprotein associated with glycosphingolipid-enriched microdomains 1 [Rhinophrynus dorsalis]
MAPMLPDVMRSGSLELGSKHTLVWVGMSLCTTVLIILFIVLCSRCYREKKKKNQTGDHENLMNVPSDKETFSHSITSLGTEPPASSYRNGAVSNGDVSEDSTAACIQPYEDVLSSMPDLCDPQDCMGKSTRCHQCRELPRIPPDSNMESVLSSGSVESDAPLGNEGPYEVLKDSSSHENIIEDSLYETVKEIKDVEASNCKEERHKTLDVTEHEESEKTKECRMEAAAEYASVDHNRKSRQSINTQSAASTPTSQDEDTPPPLPKKLLDENENVQSKDLGEEEAGGLEENLEGASQDLKRQSSLSYKSRDEDPCLTDDDISAMYSKVSRTGQSLRLEDELSHYSYIQDVAIDRSPITCNGTYATVRDIEKSPNIIDVPQSMDTINGGPDPEYEAIANLTRDEERTMLYCSANQSVLPPGESDYESIGDLQQNGDYTRL